ncbi:16S rRNA (cytidine(1402)-2'-O)-methyltransferase [endosymbiont of Metamasius hemipterus]|uniref:16S rRNA (Cytidine(1402)-2'-O)-methyltransferase n=1 Tax=endosymbiont of Metamasius hemipterus TaxID=204627 RepID=A0ABT0TWE9_9GAMM|nr:16S rRNA (cytidine(1402)-2'-O)-methyltransferase [endosymbiont of Metamasius hemipterus]
MHILKNVDLILSEDTRIIKKILYLFKIKNKIISFNDYNEKNKYKIIINKILNENINIAIIPDKGTPIINDPGFLLIKEAIKNKINIFSIPGPCSIIASLIISGLDTSNFIFKGFIPRNKNNRYKLFNKLKNNKNTIILYETSKRLYNSIIDIKNIFNEKSKIVIVKEITKKYEEIIRSDIKNIINKLNNITIKGEITILIKNYNNKLLFNNYKINYIINILKKYNINNKNIINIIKDIFNINKNKIYSIIINKKNKSIY